MQWLLCTMPWNKLRANAVPFSFAGAGRKLMHSEWSSTFNMLKGREWNSDNFNRISPYHVTDDLMLSEKLLFSTRCTVKWTKRRSSNRSRWCEWQRHCMQRKMNVFGSVALGWVCKNRKSTSFLRLRCQHEQQQRSEGRPKWKSWKWNSSINIIKAIVSCNSLPYYGE